MWTPEGKDEVRRMKDEERTGRKISAPPEGITMRQAALVVVEGSMVIIRRPAASGPTTAKSTNAHRRFVKEA